MASNVTEVNQCVNGQLIFNKGDQDHSMGEK